jgi:hypothetical protein
MKTSVLLIAGIAAVGMMASCASDKGDSPNNKGEKSTVNLSFTTGSTTRMVPGNAITTNGNDPSQEEGKLNNLAIGLFDDGNNRVSAKSGSTETTDYTYSAGGAQITTTSSATQVAVIANVPKVATTNLDITKQVTISAFRSGYIGLLSNTTSADGSTNTTMNTVNSQYMTGLPMYGEKSINWTSTNTTNNSVTVNLTRMVARVCLTKLATDFTNYSDQTATFKPTEVFMYNVKDQLTNWETGTTTFSAAEATSGSDKPGLCEMTDRTSTTLDGTNFTAPYISSLTNYAYLSSGNAIPGGWVKAPASSSGHVTKYFDYTADTDPTKDANALSFYVFPNNDLTNPTKMIIKGIFTPTGGTASIVYYPIIINHASGYNTVNGNNTPTTGDSEISANNIYNLEVTIAGRGVDEPYMPLEPSTATVNMTVTPWGETTQVVNIQ